MCVHVCAYVRARMLSEPCLVHVLFLLPELLLLLLHQLEPGLLLGADVLGLLQRLLPLLVLL